MKLPQVSLIALMVFIGVVAVELAAAQTIFDATPWMLAGVSLIVIAVQVCLLLLIRYWNRSWPRAFWAGFIVGGLLGLWSFLHVRVPESAQGLLWEAYATRVDLLLLEYFNVSLLRRNPYDPVFLFLVAIFAFLPQLLMAAVGGVVGLLIVLLARHRTAALTLMTIAAIVAANLAAVWAIPGDRPWLLAADAPGGVLLQLGLFGLVRARGGARWFWAGIVAASVLVFGSYLWAMMTTNFHSVQIMTDQNARRLFVKPVHGASKWALWMDHTALASYGLVPSPSGAYTVAWSDGKGSALAYVLVVLLPQVLIIVAGGVVGWLAAGVFSRLVLHPRGRAGNPVMQDFPPSE
jgi:hypothetical protein